MNLIVGLGNPGQTFHGTRHNVGFDVVQVLAERHGVRLDQRVIGLDGHPACVYGDYVQGERSVRLLMPLTMMNESGEALRTLEEPAETLLIVCDDVNLSLGTIRLRPHGTPGGHHGLQSCLSVLGTEQVARLRVGVGVEPLPKDLTDYVLGRFSSAERPQIREAIAQAADACEAWVEQGIEAAMNHYNRT